MISRTRRKLNNTELVPQYTNITLAPCIFGFAFEEEAYPGVPYGFLRLGYRNELIFHRQLRNGEEIPSAFVFEATTYIHKDGA